MVKFRYKSIITQLYLKAVEAVNPTKLVEETLKVESGKLFVQDKVYNMENSSFYLIGFGKAVLGMAAQCEKILGNSLKKGIICVPENIIQLFHKRKEFSLSQNSRIEVYEGAKNNLPDEKAEKGCDAAIELVKSLNSRTDKLIVLISGGGSALFPKPKDGLTLEDKSKTTSLLSSSGASINEINTVRKMISKVKGGGLAALCHPVTTITLILSDVINDPLEIIASGPTVPNPDKKSAALDIIKKYKLENKIPNNVLNTLTTASNNLPNENSKYPHVDNFIIGNNSKALRSCQLFAEANGIKSILFSNSVNGLLENVAELYKKMLLIFLNILQNKATDLTSLENLIADCSFNVNKTFIEDVSKALKDTNGTKNICVISGGEITVNVMGNGKGGRNQELALMMSKKIHELKANFQDLFKNVDVLFLSAGTDGIDGPTDAAGAIGEADVIDKALKMNLTVDKYLSNNDSYNFFRKLDNGSFLITTGHTGTNVMDVHILLIYEKSG